MKKIIYLLLASFYTISIHAETLENVSVIFLKGNVTYTTPLINDFKVIKVNDLVPVDSIITTNDKSLIKVKFNSGTIISISPNSKLKIEKIPDHKPPLVELISGKMRAQVNKSPDKEYSFYVKTHTAALGVRGTDFKILYNEKNKITSAITFTGEVAFLNSKTTKSFDSPESSEELDDAYSEILSERFLHEKTKMIRPGEFSGAYPGYTEPTVPVKLAGVQFNALKESEAIAFNETEISDEVSSALASTLEEKPSNDILVPRPAADYTKDNYPTNIVPVAGGYLDQETGFYVVPPEVSDHYGKVDAKTGDYIPPEGIKLDPLKGFVLINNDIKKLNAKTLAFITKVNSSLKKSMAKFKEITRIDASLNPSFYYDSKLTNDFYGRLDEVTNKSSSVLKFDGQLANKTRDSKNWLIYPKGSVLSFYHTDQKTPEVNKQDRVEWNIALELNHRYLIHHRPGHQILEIGRHLIYRDLIGSDHYRLFTEDTYGIFGQEFKLHDRHLTKIYGKLIEYKTYLDKKGRIWEGGFKHTIDMGRRNDLIFNYMLSREFPRDSFEIMVSEGSITHKRKHILETYTLDSMFKLRYTDLRKIAHNRGEEFLYGPSFQLTRELDDYLNFSLFYSYEKNQSEEKNLYQFSHYQIGGNLKIEF